MTQAFDLKDLEARLKAQGMPALEGLAEIVAKEVFAWTEESCAIHSNAIVKAIGAPAIAMLKPFAMNYIDKIDGQPG